MRIRYPLLFNLVVLQIAAIVIGIVATALVLNASRETYAQAVMNGLKEQVSPLILSRQEQWRTWKYLGMDDSILQETNSLTRHSFIRSIQIIPRSSVPQKISPNIFISPEQVPNNIAADEDLVVYVELDQSSVSSISKLKAIPTVWLTICLVTFIGVVLSSAWSIYKFVYLPLLNVLKVLSENKKTDTADLDGIPAKGEIKSFLNHLSELLRKNHELEKERTVLEVVRQVGHDIRSPLSSLNLVTADLDGLGEERRVLIRNALRRINDIANSLPNRVNLTASAAPDEQISAELVPMLIETVLSEKRILTPQNRVAMEIAIADDIYGLFSLVRPGDFKRVISNILNNSIEAFEDEKAGRIDVHISSDDTTLTILVRDNGKGIPEKILNTVFDKDFTYGKSQGTGLGLYHAKNCIESWGGTLTISSTINAGTTVSIRLKKASPPKWFATSIEYSLGTKFIIVDDDDSIGKIWEHRLKNKIFNAFIKYIYSPLEFSEWVTINNTENCVFLVDYEFIGWKMNGLELIKSLHIQGGSYLVTSRYEEPEIHLACEEVGVKLIPKMLAEHIPFSPKETDLRLSAPAGP